MRRRPRGREGLTGELPTAPSQRLTFSYWAIEQALATSYGIPEAARESGFRSMLSNLQKLGVLGEAARVGRGTPLTYTPDTLHRFVVALEFCELGVPPATTATLIGGYWDSKLKAICSAAERNNPAARGDVPIDPGDDIVIFLGGVGLRTSTLKGARSPAIPAINSCKLRDLPSSMQQWLTMRGPNDALGLAPRAWTVNLSARLRSVHDALSDAYAAELAAEYRTGKIEKLATRSRRKK
jgi:hypothetical protein